MQLRSSSALSRQCHRSLAERSQRGERRNAQYRNMLTSNASSTTVHARAITPQPSSKHPALAAQENRVAIARASAAGTASLCSLNHASRRLGADSGIDTLMMATNRTDSSSCGLAIRAVRATAKSAASKPTAKRSAIALPMSLPGSVPFARRLVRGVSRPSSAAIQNTPTKAEAWFSRPNSAGPKA